MAVYDSGVAAYRETTKWLTAFVPIGALVAATATIGPELVRSVQTASGLGEWIGRHWPAVACLAAILAGVVAILYWGGRVLSVAPTDLGQLQSPAFAPHLARAIGQGVTAPEFFTIESFTTAMAALAHSYDQAASPLGKEENTPAKGESTPADQLNLTRVTGAVEKLREWAVFDKVKTAFRDFIVAFAVATAVIAAAVTIAPSQLGGGITIDKPTVVAVTVDDEGRQALKTATGCTEPLASTFLAVDGSWRRPTLAVDGPDCRFGATWTPDPGHAEIRPKQ